MASIISAGTTSGTSLNLSGDTSGVLQLATNGSTTAITVDTSQNVGIGTASPGSKLAILESTNGNSILNIRNTNAGSSATSIIALGNDGALNGAYLVLNSSTNTAGGAGNSLNITNGFNAPMTFATNNAERMRINADGTIRVVSTIGVGNATPSTSGAGITFPATQSASSDANTLDDYEEGTWTPTASAQSGSLTSYTSSGQYTKVGRMVYVIGRIALTNVGTASGQLFCGGLPFSTLNTASRPSIPLCREDAVTGVVYGGYVDPSSTSFTITSLTFGSIVWTNGYVYSFCFTYQTN